MVAELLASLHRPGGEESEAGHQAVRPDRNHHQVGITGMVEISSDVSYHYNTTLEGKNGIVLCFTGRIDNCFRDEVGARVLPDHHDVVAQVELELPAPPSPGLPLSYHLPGVLTDELALAEVPGGDHPPALVLHLEHREVRAGPRLDDSVLTAGRLTGAVVVALQHRVVTGGVDQPVVLVLPPPRHHQVTAAVPAPACQAGTPGRTLLEQTPDLTAL